MTTTVDRSEKMWTCPSAPKLKITLGGKRKLQFVDGVFRTSDPVEIAAMENAMKRPNISSIVSFVDKEEAERLAREIRSQILERNKGHTGPFSGHQMSSTMARMRLEERDTRLKLQGVTDDTIQKMNEEQGLALTETVHNPKLAPERNPDLKDLPQSQEPPDKKSATADVDRAKKAFSGFKFPRAPG